MCSIENGDIRIEKEVVWLHSHVILPVLFCLTSHPVESHVLRVKFQKTHWGFPKDWSVMSNVKEMLLSVSLTLTTTTSPLMRTSDFLLSLVPWVGRTLSRVVKITIVIIVAWGTCGMKISVVEFGSADVILNELLISVLFSWMDVS